jgi:hypothetical protein
MTDGVVMHEITCPRQEPSMFSHRSANDTAR